MLIEFMTMKKIISVITPDLKTEFLDTFYNYDITKENIANTVCIMRSPSGKFSCAAFVGGSNGFITLRGARHGLDEPFCSLDYGYLKQTLRGGCPLSAPQINDVIRYIEQNNCHFIPIFEGEENPILIKSTLGEDFKFKGIKKSLETWLDTLPVRLQCEVRFQGVSYFASAETQHPNLFMQRTHDANERIDCIDLTVSQTIKEAQALGIYDLSYGVDITQPIYIPVIRSGSVHILQTQIINEAAHESGLRYGSIQGSDMLNYLLVEGDLRPGDSGAPAIIEVLGKIFYLGTVRSLDQDGRGIVTTWSQAAESTLFGDHDRDMIQEAASHKSDIPLEYPLADRFRLGNADSHTHIHCYKTGFHLKATTKRNKIEKMYIVKDNVFNEALLRETLWGLANNEFLIEKAMIEPYKQALLDEVKNYGFQYNEEPDDFKDLKEFKAFLSQKKINYTLL